MLLIFLKKKDKNEIKKNVYISTRSFLVKINVTLNEIKNLFDFY